MKLAFCLFRYFPYSGLSRVFLSVITEMAKRGHVIDAYVYEWQGEYPEGVNINLLPSAKWTNHNRDASYYKTVRPFLVEGDYDAVIGFNKMPELDFYFAGDFCYIDKISSKYSDIYRLTPRHHHFARFEKEVFGVQSNTVLLMLSESEKEIYQRNYGTGDDRFVILPPTLDKNTVISENTDHVRKQKREELSIEQTELLVLFVGSGFRIKGLDRAIQALAGLPEGLGLKTRLMVVGQDSAQHYRAMVTRLGLGSRVEFTGGRSDVPELMQAADCLIHPAYRETTGGVLLEAVASGLPVLTTDTCGYAPYITRADAGIVLESPFDQEQVTEGLLEILTSPERVRWSKNGREFGRSKDLYRMPEFTAEVIERRASNVARRQIGGTEHIQTEKSPSHYLAWLSEYNSAPLTRLFADPDGYIDDHARKIIKHDQTTTVAVVECNGQLLVLKRYNTKGPWHFFKRSVRVTRASICWSFARRLLQCGLSTPRPVGYRENRVGQFRGRSYYVAEFSEGITLFDYLKEPVNPQKLALAARLMNTFFNVMATQGLAHGDMKASNFLIEADELQVLDLDSMRAYYSGRLHQHKMFRDKRRFLRNWDQHSLVHDYFLHQLFSKEEIERLPSLAEDAVMQD